MHSNLAGEGERELNSQCRCVGRICVSQCWHLYQIHNDSKHVRLMGFSNFIASTASYQLVT